MDKAAQLNKHTIKSRRIWETPLNQIIQYSNLILKSQNLSKTVQKLKTVLSNPIQIWLNRNYKIQIHQNSRMWQDLNPNPTPCSSLVMF